MIGGMLLAFSVSAAGLVLLAYLDAALSIDEMLGTGRGGRVGLGRNGAVGMSILEWFAIAALVLLAIGAFSVAGIMLVGWWIIEKSVGWY